MTKKHQLSITVFLLFGLSIFLATCHLSFDTYLVKKISRLIVGIDEAGRGPLAGPVAVGAAIYNPDDRVLQRALRRLMPKVRDSKQLTEKHREAIYEELVLLEKNTSFKMYVSLVSASVVDMHGITHAIKKGITRVLKNIRPENCRVLLDGGLKAPAVFIKQETHIRGDATHLPIALASIAAKVVRDRHMRVLARRFPHHALELHKGYGTKAHYQAIRRHGLTSIHRKTFIRSTPSLG